MIHHFLINTGRFFFATFSYCSCAGMRLLGVKVGSGVRLNGIPFVRVAEGSNITIGDNVTINSSIYANPAGLNHRTILFTLPGAEIVIGNNTGISGATLYSAKQIVIGSNVTLGANVAIYDTDFHSLDPLERRASNQASIKSAPVAIDDDAFIGAASIILKGVQIGRCSVIGAGSVVTKNIPPYCLAAGNPAKIIKQLTPSGAV